MNPFEQQIVTDPRVLPDNPLPGLNEKPLKFLLNKFDELCKERKLPKAYLLSSPNAGYGKTFLIGRLFKELKGKGTLIYIRPIADPYRFWQGIFDRILDELCQPEEFVMLNSNRSYTQFEIFTSRVIGNLLADLIEFGLIDFLEFVLKGLVKGISDKVKVVEALRNTPNDNINFSNPSKEWIQWMQLNWWKSIDRCVEHALYERGIRAGMLYDLIPLLWVFFWYSANPEFSKRELCIEWLRGGTLDEADGEKISLPKKYLNPLRYYSAEYSAETQNDLCENRVIQFCNLAAFTRPFVFCFDQTERYGESEQLCQKLGSVVSTLVNECNNHLTIITANSYDWAQKFKNYLQKADLDRISYEKELELEGINLDQAHALVKQRLSKYPIEEKKAKELYQDLPLNFSDQTKVGIRTFLEWAKQKIDNNGPPSLEEIFNEEKKKILSGPVTFDANLFREAIRASLIGRGEKFQQIKDDYYALCWQNEQYKTVIYFGLEKSNNWNRWLAITKKTVDLSTHQDKNYRFLGVFLRTPELKEIPGKTWKIKEEINKALSGPLRIVNLDKEETATFYALSLLYHKAFSGDIRYSKEEVEKLSSEKLSSWLDSLIKLIKKNGNGNNGSEPNGEITLSVSEIIKRIVENETTGLGSQQNPLLGKYFHQIVAAFSKEVKEQNGPVELNKWLKRIEELKKSIVKESLKEKDFLKTALQEFCQGLAEQLNHYSNKLDHLFWKIEEDIKAIYTKKDKTKIKIVGRIDRLSKTEDNIIELVDYKIGNNQASSFPTRIDKLQVALYYWILKQSNYIPKRILLEYYTPQRKVFTIGKNELENFFPSEIEPVLDPLNPTINDTEKYKNKLNEFFSTNNIKAIVSSWKISPRFIRFLITKDVTEKLVRIRNREKDIQVHLGINSPPLIGIYNEYVSIDIPKAQTDYVLWREALDHLKGNLAYPIGKTIALKDSEWIIGDFTNNNYSHLLVAGTTGSGKSQFLKSLMATILYKYRTKAKIFLIDFKGTDFGPLESINDHKEAQNLLNLAVKEMDKRYNQLKRENFKDLNSRFCSGREDIPYWIIVIDEFSDMISGLQSRSKSKSEIESCIQRIAQKGRSAGIHIIISTQSPRKEVVSGLIKGNLTGIICFRVNNGTESYLILNDIGAKNLLGNGDLLCNFGQQGLLRAQSPIITDKEWEKVILGDMSI
ncbi:PD-(D/E)XK nuclease family protein [Methylacidiphilum caldifontis]|uniref:FtsK/SpoIIIE domain-containing protein n=1 Tax=Methylacidiphilum caldifontis TaxID=2795386 RepID=UPI001A8E3E34|nr:FtsK/SpoIIIE domain-containing protein [Methylacidiphilum caldifontis]QSR88553.1 PD-(D/E)XK nuclease family protein [Methylacidiphilum caldifontis]